MKPSAAIILLSLLLSLASDAGRTPAPATSSPATAPEHVTFVPVHVFIDPHGTPLAAYQVEIVADAGDATLVGIEGGDDPAYADAPYYDKRAMTKKRIIIAAFNTGTTLPTARTRVATLMFRVAGTVEPHYSETLQVAASSDGKMMPATVTLSSTTPAGASPIAAQMEGAAR
ncbi:MAG: hypothetical protein JWN24_5138 [Phycisphaerales bacterium]|nr:hypothetical protein [Phycisphaerales bacterium]